MWNLKKNKNKQSRIKPINTESKLKVAGARVVGLGVGKMGRGEGGPGFQLGNEDDTGKGSAWGIQSMVLEQCVGTDGSYT